MPGPVTRRLFLAAALLGAVLTVLSALPSFAGEVFEKGGLAIRGYDPVAYHTMEKPVPGTAEHQVSWRGATWRFASAGNKAMFEADPEKYAPAYGGYCAFAVSYGKTAKTEPDAFSIVEGRLYLNYDLGIRQRWDSQKADNIKKADANWPGIKAGL